MLNNFVPSGMQSETAPEWWKGLEVVLLKDAFKFFEYQEVKPNQFKGSCKFCKANLSSTGPSRFAIHLGYPGTGCANCRSAAMTVVEAFRALGKGKKRGCNEDVPKDPPALQITSKRQVGLVAALQVGACDAANEAIARFFYAQNIPFLAAESPQFQEMIRAIQKAPASYVAPKRKRLATNLLDSIFSKVPSHLVAIKIHICIFYRFKMT